MKLWHIVTKIASVLHSALKFSLPSSQPGLSQGGWLLFRMCTRPSTKYLTARAWWNFHFISRIISPRGRRTLTIIIKNTCALAACARNISLSFLLFSNAADALSENKAKRTRRASNHADGKMLHARACVVGKCCDLAPLRLVWRVGHLTRQQSERCLRLPSKQFIVLEYYVGVQQNKIFGCDKSNWHKKSFSYMISNMLILRLELKYILTKQGTKF